MNKIRNYTVPELDYFREVCNFTDDELYYFNLRSRDKSNIEISFEMCISEATVSRLSKRVNDKIVRVS